MGLFGKKKSKKKTPAPQVMPCNATVGSFCVVVENAETGAFISNIPITHGGPTAGAAPTDPVGLYKQTGVPPGAYNYTADFTGTIWQDDRHRDERGNITVTAGKVALAKVKVWPMGSLKVEVRQSSDKALVPATDIDSISFDGAIKLGLNTATFTKITPGSYTAKAKIKTTTYKPREQSARVVIKAHEETEAILYVQDQSWIIFHVFDATPTVEANFGQVGIAVEDLKKNKRTIQTADGTGKIEDKFGIEDGTFIVEEMTTPSDDHVYFVTDVSEA